MVLGLYLRSDFYFMSMSKATIIKLGLHKEVKKLDREIYKAYTNNDYDVPFYEMVFCNEHHCSPSDIVLARSINNSNYKRVNRLNDRIQRYLSMGVCVWLTLTFNEDTLTNTTEEQRRKYVVRYLKKQSTYYVANIDYGKSTEREHYHALVVTDYVDMNQWKYGFAYTERVKNHCSTSVKLSKYVSKLTNHAIKDSTRRSAYLYSRG